MKEDYSEGEISYPVRSSGTTYKHINGIKIYSQESLDLVRSINEDHITLEQHKIQEFCLREISHREKYINSKVLGNPYPSYTNQTIYRKNR